MVKASPATTFQSEFVSFTAWATVAKAASKPVKIILVMLSVKG